MGNLRLLDVGYRVRVVNCSHPMCRRPCHHSTQHSPLLRGAERVGCVRNKTL